MECSIKDCSLSLQVKQRPSLPLTANSVMLGKTANVRCEISDFDLARCLKLAVTADAKQLALGVPPPNPRAAVLL